MRRILCLHMPQLPIDCVLRSVAPAVDRATPHALTRPIGGAIVIVQGCPRACAAGVRPGMSLGEAQALLPNLRAAPHDPTRDQRTLARLAGWALCFSPTVEPLPPDTLALDITGCARLFGGEDNIVHQACDGLRQRGFTARAAIADTLGAAYALAIAGDQPAIIAPPGQATVHLAPLPPAALRIDPRRDAQLDAVGVRTIRDLLMLPRSTLPARFGNALVKRLQQALGEIPEPITPHWPKPRPLARRIFDGPTADLTAVLYCAGELLHEIFAQLRRHQLALRHLEVVLYYETAPPLTVAVGLARPTRALAHVAALLQQRLEQRLQASTESPDADEARPPEISGVMLVARRTVRCTPEQIALFEQRDPNQDEQFGNLIDQIASRVGHEAALRPLLLDDHQPEWAFRYVPLSVAGSEPQADNMRPATALPRPIRVLARPIPIRVIALLPDGPPTWLFYHGREYLVADAHGPERIETAWWRGPDVRRDYFRVTTRTGEQFWIFHDLDAARWYLHGMFA
jgi:protein ImuB